MGKNRLGTCVYCLRESAKLTKDHVFPKSWYPDTTPVGADKWTVPCCVDCNNKYSKLEEAVLLRLAICLSPTDARAQGIPDRVMRSIDPSSARNDRDRRLRAAKRRKLLKDIYPVDKVPKSTLPGFGPRDGGVARPMLVVQSRLEDFRDFGNKLTRGLTFVLHDQLIEEDYHVDTYPPISEQPCEFDLLVEKFGVTHYRGPGVEVAAAVPCDDPRAHAYRYVLWGRLKIYSTVTRAADATEDDSKS